MTFQLMSPPVTVREDAYITHVRQLMRDGHRSLPVVDSQSRVKGMVTLTDVIQVTSTKSDVTVIGFVRETGLATSDFAPLDAAKIFATTGFDVPVVKSQEDATIIGVIDSALLLNALSFDKKITIDTVMTRDVQACDATDPISKVWLNMAQYGFSGYPVVKKKRLIGIVTLQDILKAGHIRLEREDERGWQGSFTCRRKGHENSRHHRRVGLVHLGSRESYEASTRLDDCRWSKIRS